MKPNTMPARLTRLTRFARLLPALLCLLVPQQSAAAAADYATRPEVQAFVAEVAGRNRLDPAALLEVFAGVHFQAAVIKAIRPPSDPGIRSWRAYRSRYLDDTRIDEGLAFWARHAETLRAAEARFGVPAEIVVAIIGVETLYGRITGRFQALAALATLAFDYPPRSELFRRELEELLLLARDTGRPAYDPVNASAGALGIPQFLPSSYRRYAVDFDADGRADLSASPADAIGSVAHFLQQHGWQPGAPVAVPAFVPPAAAPLADGGVQPKYSADDLASHGILPFARTASAEPSALIDLVTPNAPTEYWLGYNNFYVLTRYNRSSFYAMAVFQLAQVLRERRGAGL
ncbi:MAG TPA: lytic murein transglycosylase B [Rhodocyclaceae bacterium]|nr:lytic murein transglycosylase B [Rhodocyclaceae bacterium]